jgi:hypothetical protein
MAIGTTLKVGFDAAAVRKGFSGLGGMFGGVMRGFRQAGIGAARQVGARMTDMLGRVLMAVPQGIKETLDWAAGLTDMSAKTGVSVEKLVLMEEALRLAGAAVPDTARMISTFADNLGEATRETGAAQDAIHKLGFKVSEFKGMAIDEAFEKIARRAGDMSWGMGEMEATMADLFGARMGMQMLGFFRDFDGSMRQAANNVGPFANRLGGTATGYDKMSDALGRFKMRWRETMSIVIDETVNMFGDDWVDQMFDFLAPEKIRSLISNVKDGLKEISSGDFWKGLMNDLGRAIGDGIKASIGDTFSLKGLVPSWMGGRDATSSTGNNDKTIARMDRQIQLLQTIATKTTGWA